MSWLSYNSGTFKEVRLGRKERVKKQQEATGMGTSHSPSPASVRWPDNIGPALWNDFALTVTRSPNNLDF